MFKHPLVSYYILNIFAKLPIHPMKTHQNLLEAVVYRIIVSIFQRRVSSRYVAGDAQFSSIDMEIADSGREGTCVVSMTITAEPKDWESATTAAVQVQPARRLSCLAKYGPPAVALPCQVQYARRLPCLAKCGPAAAGLAGGAEGLHGRCVETLLLHVPNLRLHVLSPAHSCSLTCACILPYMCCARPLVSPGRCVCAGGAAHDAAWYPTDRVGRVSSRNAG